MLLVTAGETRHSAGMRKRIQVALAVLILAVAGTIARQVAVVREPGYGGKRLSAWLADLDIGSSNSTERAGQAVRAIGTNSFPWLTRMLCASDPMWKQAVMAFNAKQSLVRVPVTSASVVRFRAVQGYNVLGRLAKDNVPALIRIMEADTSSQVRSCVAAALGGIGPEAKAAIPVLWKAVESKDAGLRKSAIAALSNIQRFDDGSAFRGRF
jgi:hypothetical protein